MKHRWLCWVGGLIFLVAGLAQAQEQVAPQPTHHASLADITRWAHVRDSGRSAHASFLERPSPRALAIAPSGAWGWANGGEDPLKRALDHCNRRGAGTCRLYAVDEDVVWPVSD